MADDKDHLARMLNALADGQHHDDPQGGHEDDSIEQPAPAPPAPPAPPPASRTPVQPAAAPRAGAAPEPAVPPAAGAPKPVVPSPGAVPRPKAVPNPTAAAATPAGTQVPQVRARPAMPQPKPAAGVVKAPVTPAPARAVQQQAPPANLRPSAPAAPPPPPNPPPAQEQFVYEQPAADEGSDDDVAAGYETRAEMQADDQVIVPAPPTEALAHLPYRPPHVPQGHMVQKLHFKQTLIPISLTLFVVCAGFVLIGLGAGPDSPFAAFKRTGIAVSFGLVALVMLAIGLVTMLQVKAELDRGPR